MDIVDSKKRSKMMSGIRGKNTKPELLVRSLLFRAGYRFRLHRNDLPGKPDIVLPMYQTAILIHGCFWHMHAGCRLAKIPTSNVDFWRKKLEANVIRDHRNIKALQESGWRVLIVWECATRGDFKNNLLAEKLSMWLKGESPLGEISSFS